MTASPRPPWSAGTLQAVAEVLGDTDDGLTGTQIGELLRQLKMDDPCPGITKSKRLTQAFVVRQNADQSSHRIITFIVRAMEPVKYRDRPELFTLRQDRLNERLTFVGLHLDDKGQMRSGAIATTLDEATRIATSVRDELRRRNVHPRVLKYCSIEILKKSNFHACLEGTKSIFAHLREITGLSSDGAALVDSSLSLGKSANPIVAINSLRTPTEEDEQKGFANFLKGLAGMYRNTTAHAPRLHRSVSEDELLEALTVVSMAHRRLDARLRP